MTKTLNCNMPLFTIDDARDAQGNVKYGIKSMFDIAAKLKDSIIMWGAPGLGKSESVKQWNAEQVVKHNGRWNPVITDVRLSMKEPVDMIGIPVITNGQTVWATPNMWPTEDERYDGGVILIDEMNQGQPAILNAAFQLIQDRQLGDYKVPNGYVIIAASNPACYNNTVSEFSLPLINRFSHFNIKSDFDSWMNYRLNNGGNVDVLSFLTSQDRSMLFKGFDDVDESESVFDSIVITPRSWEVVERLLNLPDIPLDQKKAYATGRLGLAITARLFEYLENKDKYQSCDEILVEGKNFKSEDVNQFFATQISCISKINTTADDETCRKYVLNFLKATRNLQSNAFKATNLTTLISSKRLLGKTKIFNPMLDANDLLKLITSALK